MRMTNWKGGDSYYGSGDEAYARSKEIVKALWHLLSTTIGDHHRLFKVYANEVSAGILREGCIEKFSWHPNQEIATSACLCH